MMIRVECLAAALVLGFYCGSFGGDISSECGVYQERIHQLKSEIKDNSQFTKEVDHEMKNIRNPQMAERKKQLQNEGLRLRQERRRLESELSNAQKSWANCVEKYKQRKTK
jgi:cell shape-determining protein MreC